ncbi:MAG TPA: PIN domain-containing protein [Candidatus Saccharimonadales bacterium]|nr:PIN domain-containing protein [Candidatus Saccharimonadales bacterium]
MTAQCFADTNIFLYAGSKDPADAAKKKIARRLIAFEDIGLSAQVLQEFIAAAASKQRLGIDAAEAKATLGVLVAFPIVPITAGLVLQAWEIKSRYQISYWDAAIIAAAQELSCEVIYSEDLNDGQNYAGVVVRNPFART